MMKLTRFFYLAAFLNFGCTTTQTMNRPYQEYDKAPELIQDYRFIVNNLKYPEAALKKGIEGKAIVLAYIDSLGSVDSAFVVKEDYPGNGLGQAAVDVVKLTTWKAAEKNGHPIKCRITMPIIFKLSDRNK